MNGVDHLPTKAVRPKLKLYHFDKHRKLAFFESYIQAVCISKGEESGKYYLIDAQRVKKADNIINKVIEICFLWLRWLVRQSIAPEINGYCSVASICDSNQLVPPCIPYFRKSMQEHHYLITCSNIHD